MSIERALLEQFELTNRRHSLLRRGDRVVVGVSGGADSLALLELLSKCARKYSLSLSVAHLDHGLQKAARKAGALAKKAADRHALPFHEKKVDLRKIAAKNHWSLEEAGRKERYRFFEEVAKKTRSNKLATAHTLDDQAETVLMRLIRGSGLRGLSGIPYKRVHGRFEVIRPLLDCSKKDLVRFLKKENILFADDRMNYDPAFFRNRVRHELLPLLNRRFNPQVQQALASLQAISGHSQDYLELHAQKEFKRCLVRLGRKNLSLNAARLKSLHPAMRYEVLALAAVKMRGDLTGFGFAHWSAAEALLSSLQKNTETHWPHGLRVQKRGLSLAILAP